ncbi:indolepyruvate oxidoreductase subunit beta [Neptuniibacter caesariensis]|uniref:Indolepyruvate ferredoxin oxidoreductase, beta subunit n=1 Tax=Neptuniibacter caesariensis TaxID=207954 RepID=A0A7U8C5G4_NEPCE|nr:indolepyruvate oxidoreductase subunit beta [Neptuniibacter caesariensis]EAR61877.1 indolepyruvate ferredoxin oxidoreductase, beta subunit [Oceanospirillum sp. MED92] [Neptuniibacter caesariensis]
MKNEVTNIMVCGIGGQGVMTAADILANTALDMGYDVKKTEVAGMAQRGGVVTSHVRFGNRVLSPSIAPGEADLILAFEPAEALRWSEHLRPSGKVMVNSYAQLPPVVSIGLFDYPDNPFEQLLEKGLDAHQFDAGHAAIDLGDRRLINSIMLGAIADHLPFPAETLEQHLLARFAQKGQSVVDMNKEAFSIGRTAFA